MKLRHAHIPIRIRETGCITTACLTAIAAACPYLNQFTVHADWQIAHLKLPSKPWYLSNETNLGLLVIVTTRVYGFQMSKGFGLKGQSFRLCLGWSVEWQNLNPKLPGMNLWGLRSLRYRALHCRINPNTSVKTYNQQNESSPSKSVVEETKSNYVWHKTLSE